MFNLNAYILQFKLKKNDEIDNNNNNDTLEEEKIKRFSFFCLSFCAYD